MGAKGARGCTRLKTNGKKTKRREEARRSRRETRWEYKTYQDAQDLSAQTQTRRDRERTSGNASTLALAASSQKPRAALAREKKLEEGGKNRRFYERSGKHTEGGESRNGERPNKNEKIEFFVTEKRSEGNRRAEVGGAETGYRKSSCTTRRLWDSAVGNAKRVISRGRM